MIRIVLVALVAFVSLDARAETLLSQTLAVSLGGQEVGTIEARRGRGYASAAVHAASAYAGAAGRAPVFLLTDGSDWPQQLYRRLGFDEIGVVHEFLKSPLGRG